MASRALKDALGRRRRGVPERSRRGGLVGELALAVPPTLTILGVLFFVEALVRRQLLFASLASSAFLIYRAPEHRMNSVRVMVSAQVIAVAIGLLAARFIASPYVAAGVAMAVTILLLIVFDVVHPPAVSTALGFAFLPRQDQVVGIFLLSLGLVAALVILQRIALWTLRRVQAAGKGSDA